MFQFYPSQCLPIDIGCPKRVLLALIQIGYTLTPQSFLAIDANIMKTYANWFLSLSMCMNSISSNSFASLLRNYWYNSNFICSPLLIDLANYQYPVPIYVYLLTHISKATSNPWIQASFSNILSMHSNYKWIETRFWQPFKEIISAPTPFLDIFIVPSKYMVHYKLSSLSFLVLSIITYSS
jgi:hypothetical protein